MQRLQFGSDWTVGPKGSIFEALTPASSRMPVTLPHDAVLAGGRAADGSGGSHTGYFFGGEWTYEKTFDAPTQWQDEQIILEFEGVYREAMVYINGALVGQRPSGYARFFVDATAHLNYDRPNVVKVEASAHHDSRWYTGGGIYRPVNLLRGGRVHVTPEGPRITPLINSSGSAVIKVDADIVNRERTRRTVTVEVQIRDAEGAVVAEERGPVTVLPGETLTSRLRLYIDNPVRWGEENPYLYDVNLRVTDGDAQLDEAVAYFGIRTIELDPRQGLLINGEVVNLRGACIHHDNGIVGAASFAAADERRVRILKESGFNAIRSAHNPIGSGLLEACDRLGMYVMDELSDVWNSSKTEYDYSRDFAEWWERDTDAMVDKDFNHPSVIMYSIGNEILEVGSPDGARQGRLIAERIRSRDSSRIVLNSLNSAIAAVDHLAEVFGALGMGDDDASAGAPTEGFNAAIAVQDVLAQVMQLPMIGDLIEESCSFLDVVGYNYGDARYLQDHEAHPNRIFVGSETFPTQIDHLWHLVTTLPYLIGDFTWVGWDYLGETGVGRVKYPDDGVDFSAPYPWLTTCSGDIDITGHRRAPSYYREVVFGRRTDPYLVVQDPAHVDRPAVIQAWSWNDATPSWDWNVSEGTAVVAEAYVDAEEVAFILNGTEVARAFVGEEKAFIARASVPYHPGTLVAVAYRDGQVSGECQLRSSGSPAAVTAKLSAPKDRVLAHDLDFVEILVVDADGHHCPSAEVSVTVVVDGAGTLQGLGTGRPVTEESFLADTCTTFGGRALAAIRPGSSDEPYSVTVKSGDLASARIDVV